MIKRMLIHFYLAFILLIAFSCQNESEIIEVPITNIELSLSSDYIEVGLTDTIKLVIHPQDATNKDYIWSSSEPSIAEVGPDGVVKGISPGKAIIKITTEDNGFTASYTVQIIKWTYHYSQNNAHVRPIAVDSEDNVWSGGDKLTRISNNMQEVYTNISNITAIAVNNENRWFGTHNSGIWKFDGANWTNYAKNTNNQAFGSVNYNSMMIDDKDNLWFGTASGTRGTGVTMFDGSQWYTFNSDNGLVYNNVLDMAIDKKGVKWFATSRGLSSFDDSQWISYTSESTGIEILDYVFSVAIDKENNKWFGSYQGALKFDGTNWTLYDRSNSDMKWTSINAITVDKDNNIWFATEAGVTKSDGTSWINYTCATEKDYKLHNVRAIDIDSKGNIWLGTTYTFIKLEE